MNKNNVPWIREWEQLEECKREESVVVNLFYLFVFIAMSMLIALMFVDGLDRTIALKEAKADGRLVGKVELLQQVSAEIDKEDRTWLVWYRAASQPGMSGFDGLLLVDNK